MTLTRRQINRSGRHVPPSSEAIADARRQLDELRAGYPTDGALAAALGVTRSYLALIRGGHRAPPPSTWERWRSIITRAENSLPRAVDTGVAPCDDGTSPRETT